MANDPKWMEHANKHPGRFHEKARKAGQLTAKGTIKKSWMQQLAKSGTPLEKKEAVESLTKARLRKRKK